MDKLLTMKDDTVLHLRNEVEATFGRKVRSSRDCIQLVEEIYKRTSFKINVNTLRRFFGLVKTDNQPSLSTLQILSNFCGFDTVEEFAALHRQGNGEDEGQWAGTLRFLTGLFRQTTVAGDNNETFLSVVRQTILFLRKHPFLVDKLQRTIAKTKSGQDYYFEQFIDYDGLNGAYGAGIRHYLAEKKSAEAQVFGYSLLALNAFLTEDKAALGKYTEKISQYPQSRNHHPFVSGRQFATQLLAASPQKGEAERILTEAYHFHSGLRPSRDGYRLFPCFEFNFGTALVLTGHFNEALYYLHYGMKNYPERQFPLYEAYDQTYLLLVGIAEAGNENRGGAEALFQQLKPGEFYFLTKKTDTVLYLILAALLNKLNKAGRETLATLVRETGFTRFNRMLENIAGTDYLAIPKLKLEER